MGILQEGKKLAREVKVTFAFSDLQEDYKGFAFADKTVRPFARVLGLENVVDETTKEFQQKATSKFLKRIEDANR